MNKATEQINSILCLIDNRDKAIIHRQNTSILTENIITKTTKLLTNLQAFFREHDRKINNASD